jgi:hypothetical protein
MRHLITAVALLGVVGSEPAWQTPTPPARPGPIDQEGTQANENDQD